MHGGEVTRDPERLPKAGVCSVSLGLSHSEGPSVSPSEGSTTIPEKKISGLCVDFSLEVIELIINQLPMLFGDCFLFT